MQMMKALIAPHYGDADVLRFEDVPIPTPRQNEVLVRVMASTVNRSDTSILSGKPLFARIVFGLSRPKRRIPGTEFAGIVEKAGSDYPNLKPGDRVFGFHDEGAYSHAEYLVVSAREAVARIPEGISFATAAAASEGPFYALNLLKNVTCQDGSRALINGISGSIGSAMLQLLKKRGAFVVGVCSEDAAPRLLELGADRVHDYRKTDFRDVEDQPFDFILDTVGNRSYRDCRSLLADGGTYSSTELGPWSQNALYAIASKLTGRRRAIFPIPRDASGCQNKMLTAIANQQYVPLIDRVFPFDQIVDAYRYVAAGKKTGNVVIKFGSKT